MAPGKYDIAIYQGDSFSMTVFLRQKTTPVSAYDLTGWTAKAQAKSKETSVLALDFSCAIDAVAGSITITASASDTALMASGKYFYDLQITDGSLVQTVLRGTAIVTEEVTTP